MLNDKGDVTEAWTGESIKKLRTHLKHNDLSQGCDRCMHHIEKEKFIAVGAGQYDQFNIQKQYPVSLEFNLQNSTEDLHEWLDYFIPHLKTARFLGPEPFLNDLYYKIWEEIISVNRNCVIDVHTNGKVLDKRVTNIISKGLFRIRISANGLFSGRFDTPNEKANHEMLKNNINFFIKNSHRENIPVHLVFKPDRDNWKFAPQTIELCNQLQTFADIDLTDVEGDSSLWSMSKTETKSVYDYLITHQPKGKGLIAKINDRKYSSFLKYFS